MKNLFTTLALILACAFITTAYAQTYTLSGEGRYHVNGSFNSADNTLSTDIIINIPVDNDATFGSWGSDAGVKWGINVAARRDCVVDMRYSSLRNDGFTVPVGSGNDDTAKRCRGGGSAPGNADANGISLLVTWRVADDETNTSGANLWVATVVITPSSTAVSPGGSNPEPVPPGVSVPITIPAPTAFRLTTGPDSNGMTVQWDSTGTNANDFRFVLYEGTPTQRIFPAVLPWRSAGFTDGKPNISINFATYRSHLRHATEYTMQLKYVTDSGSSAYAQLGFRTPSPLPFSSVAVPTSVEDEELPEGIALAQNYPNPFNPVTTIKYSVQAASHVSLSVYDMTGQQIETLVDGVQPKGTHSVAFDANGLPTGTYVYRLTTGAETLTRIMTLVR